MSFLAGRAGIALALALCAVGCGEAREGPQGVILVLLDTVRADHLGCYGYERPTSPRLDRLASEGARFDQAIAAAPWTLPSVASLLSGEHPERAYTPQGLRSSVVETLRGAGVRTAAFTEGGYVSGHFGFGRGFEFWEEEQGAVQLPQPGLAYDPGPRGGGESSARLRRPGSGSQLSARYASSC